MNVSLTPHLVELVQRQVGSGRYATASEVVREALRLFEEMEAACRRETQQTGVRPVAVVPTI